MAIFYDIFEVAQSLDKSSISFGYYRAITTQTIKKIRMDDE